MNAKTEMVKTIINGLNIKSILAEELEKIEKIADVLIKNNYVKSCVINPDGYYLQCPYCGGDVTCLYFKVEQEKYINELNRLKKLLEHKHNELVELRADYEEMCDDYQMLRHDADKIRQLVGLAKEIEEAYK